WRVDLYHRALSPHARGADAGHPPDSRLRGRHHDSDSLRDHAAKSDVDRGAAGGVVDTGVARRGGAVSPDRRAPPPPYGFRRGGGARLVRRPGQHRAEPVHRFRAAVRGRLGAAAGRDHRRRRAGAEAAMTQAPLEYYLLLSAVLFAIGVAGVVIRRDVIVILMSIELMLNAVNLTFIAFSRFL